jgi:hypothetical protein
VPLVDTLALEGRPNTEVHLSPVANKAKLNTIVHQAEQLPSPFSTVEEANGMDIRGVSRIVAGVGGLHLLKDVKVGQTKNTGSAGNDEQLIYPTLCSQLVDGIQMLASSPKYSWSSA